MRHYKKINNVLRVTPSFASYTKPGSGTNSYFHSKYSRFNSFVLTLDKKLDYLEVNKKTTIKTIKTFNIGLGKVGGYFFIFLFFVKFLSTCTFFFKSIKYIKEVKPDVVHLYSPIYFLVGLYCKLVYNSKIIMSIHGTDGLRISKNRFLKLVLLIPDLTLSLSRNFINQVESKNVKYLGNGYDDSVFKLNNSDHPRKKYFITVGNLRWQKGHLNMIKAFSVFHEKNKGYKLIIVGDGNLRKELELEISNLNLVDVVLLVGKKDQKEVADLMSISSYFILTSVSEGFPKVVYEALASGLPVISTDVGDVKRKIDKDSGLIVNNNIVSISEGMNKIIHSRFNRVSISDKVKCNGWINIAQKLDEFYEKKY